MQHRRSSAALMDSDAPVGFQRHACGLQRVLLMQDLGSTVAGVVSSDPFFCIFQVQCRTGGFQRPKHRGSSPARLDSSASGLRNMCEQRSCTQDTSNQLLRRSLTPPHKDKERRPSPLNEPVDSFNFGMICLCGLPYGHPLTVDLIVCLIFIMFCELKCNGWI